MMQFSDIQFAIAQTFLGGNMTMSGIIMYAVVLALILAITKSPFTALVLGLPITVLFAGLGILSGDMTIIMIVIIVIGLAFSSSKISIGGRR